MKMCKKCKKPEATKLATETINRNTNGHAEFKVIITVGNWEALRRVVVTDMSVNINDVMRLIGGDESIGEDTGLLDPSQTYGTLNIHGRQVGHWDQLLTDGAPDFVEFAFPFPNGDEGRIEIAYE